MKEADRRNLVIAQIETEKGLEAVEEIAAVDGIDCLWLGHFDLTNFLGIPASSTIRTSPAAVKRIVAAGRRTARRSASWPPIRPGEGTTRKLGFNMIASGTDQGILIGGRPQRPAVRREQVMTFKVGVTRDLRLGQWRACFGAAAFEVLKANHKIDLGVAAEDLDRGARRRSPRATTALHLDRSA